MRLKSIEMAGFRGFAQSRHFDLDAEAVILVGVNGQGKTSFFDGVLWALTGNLPRLGADGQLVSLYSESGEARVSLELRHRDGELYKITRSFDGQNQRLSIEHGGGVVREAAAQTRLLQIIWPEALSTPDGSLALTTAITRSVYLQQDLVRQFIEADTDQDRFKSASELIGAGRVNELQLELERSRTAWTRVTNQRQREAEEPRIRLKRLEEQLAALGLPTDTPRKAFSRIWTDWWAELGPLGLDAVRVPEAGSPEAPSALDEAIRQVSALRRAAERRRALMIELLSEMETRVTSSVPNVEPLSNSVQTAQHDLEVIQAALLEAEGRAAAERRALTELREIREELRALAGLALRHLGDLCPVCGQNYDEVSTRRHLVELLGSPSVDVTPQSTSESIINFARAVQERQQALIRADSELRHAEEESRRYTAWITERDCRLEELGVLPTLGKAAIEVLRDRSREVAEAIEKISVLQQRGETFGLMLTRWSEQARRAELERELTSTRAEVEVLDRAMQSRERTGQLANQMLDALREATHDVVGEQLERVEPLLQRVYASIDPHPAFRVVRFLARVARGRGRLATLIDDTLANRSSETPSAVLSSSQMNALAVAVFLTFNLGIPTLPLQVAMLDDPLQSLDDVNLLGLIDLLRRTKERRQLIVATHDVRFGGLLERKLRPVAEGQRTVVIELEGWSREGPIVEQRDVVRDLRKILVAV